MSARAGLTAEELLASLRRRQAALPSEIGTFMVFEVCEAVVASGPVVVLASSVRIDTEGGVSLLPGGQAADDVRAARSIHALLTTVLVNARPGPPPQLMEIVERGPSAGEWSLSALRDDLEASLVPLNRLASRRVLARLLREAAADRMRGSAPPGPKGFDELDAELADLLGDDGTPRQGSRAGGAPEPIAQAASRAPAAEVGPPAVEPPPGVPQPPPEQLATVVDPGAVPPPAANEALIPTDRMAEFMEQREGSLYPSRRKSGFGLWLGLGLVALALALAGVVVVVRPDVLAKLRGQPSDAPAPMPSPALPDPAAPRAGELMLTVEPAGSQVLLRVGTAPVEVGGVAVGQAEEFVAMAPGHAPSRALIAKDDPWEKTEEGPFFELAMQTRPLAKGSKPRLGDSLLPVDPGTARRRDGRVRIVTSPRGAEVFRLVGFAPEVRIQNLDTSLERSFLVQRDGYEPHTVQLRPQDWPSGDTPVLREQVKLQRAKRN